MIQAAIDGMTFSTELRRLWAAAGPDAEERE